MKIGEGNVILPKWAKNRHQFIALNYLALENPKTTAKLNCWIDLIFGVNQQKNKCFNSFKPLTSDVIRLILIRNM